MPARRRHRDRAPGPAAVGRPDPAGRRGPGPRPPARAAGGRRPVERARRRHRGPPVGPRGRRRLRHRAAGQPPPARARARRPGRRPRRRAASSRSPDGHRPSGTGSAVGLASPASQPVDPRPPPPRATSSRRGAPPARQTRSTDTSRPRNAGSRPSSRQIRMTSTRSCPLAIAATQPPAVTARVNGSSRHVASTGNRCRTRSIVPSDGSQPQLGPQQLGVVVELAQRPGPVPGREVGGDERAVRRSRTAVRGAPPAGPARPRPSARPFGDQRRDQLGERPQHELAEVLALLDHPVLVPAGQEVVVEPEAGRDARGVATAVGQAGGVAGHDVHVDLDLGVEPHQLAVGRDERTRPVSTPQRRPQVGGGPLLVGLGPQHAGQPAPRDRAVLQCEVRDEALRRRRNVQHTRRRVHPEPAEEPKTQPLDLGCHRSYPPARDSKSDRRRCLPQTFIGPPRCVVNDPGHAHAGCNGAVTMR